MTLRTLAEIAFALNVRIDIDANKITPYRYERSGKPFLQYGVKRLDGAPVWATIDRSPFTSYSLGGLSPAGRYRTAGPLQRRPAFDFPKLSGFLASVTRDAQESGSCSPDLRAVRGESEDRHSLSLDKQFIEKEKGGPALAA